MKMTLTAGVAALLAMAASVALAEEAGQGAGNCNGQNQQAPALPPVSHTKTFRVVGQ